MILFSFINILILYITDGIPSIFIFTLCDRRFLYLNAFARNSLRSSSLGEKKTPRKNWILWPAYSLDVAIFKIPSTTKGETAKKKMELSK